VEALSTEDIFLYEFELWGGQLFNKIGFVKWRQPCHNRKSSVVSAYHYGANACMHMLTVASECWHLQNGAPTIFFLWKNEVKCN